MEYTKARQPQRLRASTAESCGIALRATNVYAETNVTGGKDMRQFGKRCAILVLIAILLTSAFSAALAEFKPPRGIGFGNLWAKGAEKK